MGASCSSKLPSRAVGGAAGLFTEGSASIACIKGLKSVTKLGASGHIAASGAYGVDHLLQIGGVCKIKQKSLQSAKLRVASAQRVVGAIGAANSWITLISIAAKNSSELDLQYAGSRLMADRMRAVPAAAVFERPLRAWFVRVVEAYCMVPLFRRRLHDFGVV